MQTAQVVVVSVWLMSLRSNAIKDRKQLEKDLKDHKDKKSKAKAGGRKQVDNVRINLEETINALPKYEVSRMSSAALHRALCSLYTGSRAVAVAAVVVVAVSMRCLCNVGQII